MMPYFSMSRRTRRSSPRILGPSRLTPASRASSSRSGAQHPTSSEWPWPASLPVGFRLRETSYRMRTAASGLAIANTCPWRSPWRGTASCRRFFSVSSAPGSRWPDSGRSPRVEHAQPDPAFSTIATAVSNWLSGRRACCAAGRRPARPRRPRTIVKSDSGFRPAVATSAWPRDAGGAHRDDADRLALEVGDLVDGALGGHRDAVDVALVRRVVDLRLHALVRAMASGSTLASAKANLLRRDGLRARGRAGQRTSSTSSPAPVPAELGGDGERRGRGRHGLGAPADAELRLGRGRRRKRDERHEDAYECSDHIPSFAAPPRPGRRRAPPPRARSRSPASPTGPRTSRACGSA